MNTIPPKSSWLIIRNGAVGDTLLLSPVLQAIRALVPDAWIEVMGNLERVELLVGSGLADQAMSFEQPGIDTLFADGVELPQHLHRYFNRFDVIVYYGQSSLERVHSKLQRNRRQTVITHPAFPANEDVHITKHYLQALEMLADTQQDDLPKTGLSDEETTWGKQWLEDRVDRIEEYFVLGIHAGAGSKAKRSPFSVFHQKMNEVKASHRPLLLLPQGPADDEAVDAFITSLPDEFLYVTAEGLRLRELAAVLSHCHEFMGNDSGITHLAAALGIPTTAVFVSSNPMVWQPLGGHVKVIMKQV